MAGAIAFGGFSEHVAFGLDNPRRWVPDFLVGVALTSFGLWGLRWDRQTGALLVAAGLAWWVGNLAPAFLYLHRGLMLHAVATYPGLRPRTPSGVALLALGYLFATWVPLATTDPGTAAFGLVAVAVASLRSRFGKNWARRHRRAALEAAVALMVGSTGSVLIRIIPDSPQGVEPALVLYGAGLIAAAAFLTLGLRNPSSGSIADLVVEIGESRSSTVRDSMARLLDDPLLEVGVRRPDGTYVDAHGAPIGIPDGEGPRMVSWVGHGSPPPAVIVHARTLLADSALLEAIDSVMRMSSANAELTAQARHRLTELTAARRRLLQTEDEERRRLAKSLHERTESNLIAVERVLTRVIASTGGHESVRNAAAGALEQLRLAQTDLETIARGLHPWESSSNLESALVAMASGAAIPVSVNFATCPERREVASAIYYLFSEAVANTLKHASADQVEIELTEHEGALIATVSDDGRGGADPSKGTGLKGLSDRVAGLGGELVVSSPRGRGTRLTATFRSGTLHAD